MGEMHKTSNDYCYSCMYFSGVKRDANKRVCMYYLKTGKRRGCKVGECDKYEKKERKHARALQGLHTHER